MKASFRILTPIERAALNGHEVAAANSAALKAMLETMSAAGKSFVQAGDDLMPTDAAEEGMPLVGRDELHPIPRLPDHGNSPYKIGCSGCEL